MNLKSQSGLVLVISLLMLLVLTVIGIAVISSSTFETKLAAINRGETNALYSTDGTIQLLAGNSENFITGKFSGNKYNPFTDSSNLNPGNAKVEITYIPDQIGSPRGLGFSSTSFEFEYFSVNATGQDQVETISKSSSVVEEKFVRLVPSLQNGN
jgi:hypothetical protein